MGRRPRVDRTPEENWQIVQEGIKSGNVSETCRRHGISPSLFPHVRRAPRPDKLPGAAQVSRSKGPTLCWRKGWGTRRIYTGSAAPPDKRIEEDLIQSVHNVTELPPRSD
jgi:transposase-like protein